MTKEKMNIPPAIEIKNLQKFFGGNEALKGISVEFKPNSITGFIGFNGSGKTTTFNLLSGFLEANKGIILFNGKHPTINTWRQIAYLAAGSEPKNSTRVIKHLLAIASMYCAKKEWALEKITALSKTLEFTNFLHKPIKTLSKGNQQKVKIIASFLNPDVKYIFLDEPFDGLDPIMVNKVMKLYQNLTNITIIITSHRMEVVQEMTKEFYVLKNGKIVDFKKTDDPTVLVQANVEIPISFFNSLPYIKKITKKNDNWEILITNIKHFKDLSKKLVSSPKYNFLSVKAKSIAESVFNEYLGGNK